MNKFLSELKYDLNFLRSHTLQPKWFKVFKVFLVFGFLWGYDYLFGDRKTIIFSLVFLVLMLGVHFLYRGRTKRYSQSWLDFIVYEEDGERKYKRIGAFYYGMVLASGTLAHIISQVING
jgi:hypothetical protein